MPRVKRGVTAHARHKKTLDLAKGYLLAAQRKLPGVERIIIGSPTAQPMQRVFGLFCQEAGLAPPERAGDVPPLAQGVDEHADQARPRAPVRVTVPVGLEETDGDRAEDQRRADPADDGLPPELEGWRTASASPAAVREHV